MYNGNIHNFRGIGILLNIGAFLSYVFVVTFTPGPNNIMAMANAGKYGFKKTLKFNAGVFTGFLVLLLSSSYFNLFLFNIMPRVKVIMGIIGAAYMLYLAFKIMNSKESNEENDPSDDSEDKKLNLYFTGLALQIVNPKVILYSITVISNFIIPYYKSNIALILFSILLALIGFISITSWALFGSLFNKFLYKYKKQFNIVMGILLIYSAISISGINLF